MGLTLTVRGHIAFFSAKFASLGVFDREFRGKEQQEKPRVREFRELWIASLRGLGVFRLGYTPLLNIQITLEGLA